MMMKEWKKRKMKAKERNPIQGDLIVMSHYWQVREKVKEKMLLSNFFCVCLTVCMENEETGKECFASLTLCSIPQSVLPFTSSLFLSFWSYFLLERSLSSWNSLSFVVRQAGLWKNVLFFLLSPHNWCFSLMRVSPVLAGIRDDIQSELTAGCWRVGNAWVKRKKVCEEQTQRKQYTLIVWRVRDPLDVKVLKTKRGNRIEKGDCTVDKERK